METIKEIVCRNCKRLLGKSQNLSEIARLMQINPTTISKWKSGLHAPELDKIDKLAQILNVDPLEFFKRDSEPDAMDMIRQIAALEHRELNLLRETLEALSKPIQKKTQKKEA